MKKLISIGVALALLVMVVVPVSVAAQDIENPGTYSKTPFANAIPLIADMIPFDITAVTGPVGGYLGDNLAWMTDMTAWSMVLAGDIVKKVDPVIGGVVELPINLGDVADIFYVVSARLWDPWGEYAGEATLPDVVIDVAVLLGCR